MRIVARRNEGELQEGIGEEGGLVQEGQRHKKQEINAGKEERRTMMIVASGKEVELQCRGWWLGTRRKAVV